MNTEIIIAIICAVFASSGLWGLIQFLINRKDKTGEKIDKLTMYSKMAEDELVHADYVRTMAQEFVDGLSYVSDKDKDYWKMAIDYFADMTAKAKLMLSK